MLERDLDPRDDDGLHEPRFGFSHRRAVFFVIGGYICLVALVAAFLALLELAQNYNDFRNVDATVIFAVVMAVPFGRALRAARRGPRLPAYRATMH